MALDNPGLSNISFCFARTENRLLIGIEWKLRWFSLSFPIFLRRLRVTGMSLNKS